GGVVSNHQISFASRLYPAFHAMKMVECAHTPPKKDSITNLDIYININCSLNRPQGLHFLRA
ncbi:hypothetical protein ACM5QL_004860, partial [Escherichia coli]